MTTKPPFATPSTASRTDLSRAPSSSARPTRIALASLLAAALVTGTTHAAAAEPTPRARTTALAPGAAPPRSASERPSPRADAARYAAREAMNRSVADFRGGASVVVISGSTVTLVLLVVLLVILL